MRKALLILLAAANVVLCVFILRGPSYSERTAAQVRPDPATQTSVTTAPSSPGPSAETHSPAATATPAPGTADTPAPPAAETPVPAQPRDWSAVDRPEEEDFDWYWDFEEIPDDAVWMTRIDELAGNWKTMTLYLGHDDETLIAIELATIGISTESSSLIYQGDKIVFDGDDDWYDESGDPALVYSYELSGDGSIIANATGNTIELYMFWEYGNKQYAIGDMALPDGTSAYLALVRP